MKVATNGNVRTANAAMESGMNKALKIAFRSGAVMGLCVSGLGLFGLGVVVCVLDLATVTQCVTGFGLAEIFPSSNTLPHFPHTITLTSLVSVLY